MGNIDKLMTQLGAIGDAARQQSGLQRLLGLDEIPDIILGIGKGMRMETGKVTPGVSAAQDVEIGCTSGYDLLIIEAGTTPVPASGESLVSNLIYYAPAQDNADWRRVGVMSLVTTSILTSSFLDRGSVVISDAATLINARWAGGVTYAWTAYYFDQIAEDAESGTVEAIPDYVKTEARRVLGAVAAAQNANTVTLLALSDSHQLTGNANITTGNLHAGLAAKIIAQAIHLDFAAFLGDYTAGGGTTTVDGGKAEIAQVNRWIEEAFASVPNFRAVGNHDSLLYSYDQNGDYLRPSQLYDLIGKYNEGASVDADNLQRGYCCRDFADRQLRVILLNTADGEESGAVDTTWRERISPAQMQWFAAALDLSGKSSPGAWSILVLSHHPLDWGALHPATKLINAYVSGSSVSFAHEGVQVSYDYAGKNAARFVANIHGHVHGYKVDDLHLVVDNVGVPIVGAKRIATPNACFARNNEYGANGATEYYGIEFGEDVSYDKTVGTGQDTAFAVYVIDLAAQTVQAIHYGAGYDRVIGYGEVEPVVYTVSQVLTHVASSNAAASVVAGNAFTAVLTAQAGYTLGAVTVTMGGVDITDAAVTGGSVNIAAVTGDLVITAAAEVIPTDYTNLLLTATDISGAVLDGTGYRDGVYCSSSAPGEYSADAAYWSTGLIPYAVPYTGQPQTVYIKGWTWTAANHCRLQLIKANKSGFALQISGSGTELQALETYFDITVLDADTGYAQLVPKMYDAATSELVKKVEATKNTGYFRISMPGTGAGVVITVGEPIE